MSERDDSSINRGGYRGDNENTDNKYKSFDLLTISNRAESYSHRHFLQGRSLVMSNDDNVEDNQRQN